VAYYRHYKNLFLTWILFFLICFGLGYPTLNRYDPRNAMPDTIEYFRLVEGNPNAIGHWRFRVLIPYLARPIYWLTNNKLNTWNPLSFSMLVINSIFCATIAYILLILGIKTVGNYNISLLASMIYLLNFSISNFHLSGLVDSGEGLFIMLVVYSLFAGNYYYLPIIGILGAMAKETFVPLSLSLAIGWHIGISLNNNIKVYRKSLLIWSVVMFLLGLFTVVLIQSFLAGQLILPWDIIKSEKRGNIIIEFFNEISQRNFWFVFIWLIPLGLWRLKSLNKPWVIGSIASGFMALLLGAFHAAGGNVARACFNVIGPILSLSSAIFLTEEGRIN
jgi:hypothetical protein